MKLPVALKAFDGQNALAIDCTHGRCARSDGLILYDYGAGTANTFATAVLRSGQPEVGAQDPQQHSFVINADLRRRAIEYKRDCSLHERGNTPSSTSSAVTYVTSRRDDVPPSPFLSKDWERYDVSR